MAVLCFLWALAFGLQLGESSGIGRRLVGVDDLGGALARIDRG
jgi:hypothetical protein